MSAVQTLRMAVVRSKVLSVFCQIYLPVGTLPKHLFEVIMTPDILLNTDLYNCVSPLLEFTFVKRNKLERTIISRELNMWHCVVHFLGSSSASNRYNPLVGWATAC